MFSSQLEVEILRKDYEAEMNKMKPRLVFFDVQATGTSIDDQIIQLVATKSNYDMFQVYMMPLLNISEASSAMNGLQVHGKKLYHNGEVVPCVGQRIAMQSFIEYLKPGPVILMAHNGKHLHFPLLLNEIAEANMLDDFDEIIFGFCDSLQLLKNRFPERRAENLSFRLVSLYRDLVKDDLASFPMDSHYRVLMLRDIFNCVEIKFKYIVDHCSSFIVEMNACHRLIVNAANRSSLNRAFHRLLPPRTIRRMSSVGISFELLREKYQKMGAKGVIMLLTKPVDGRPLVMLCKYTLGVILATVKRHVMGGPKFRNNSI